MVGICSWLCPAPAEASILCLASPPPCGEAGGWQKRLGSPGREKEASSNLFAQQRPPEAAPPQRKEEEFPWETPHTVQRCSLQAVPQTHSKGKEPAGLA